MVQQAPRCNPCRGPSGMRAIRSEQFAQRKKWHISIGHRAMVLRHGFAEGGERA